MPLSEVWQEEADTEVNLESFYGDFSRAFAPISAGFSLQELSHIDITTGGLSTDSSTQMSFVAVCLLLLQSGIMH